MQRNHNPEPDLTLPLFAAEREKNGGDSTHATSSTEEGDGAGSGGGSGGGDEYEMDLMLQSMGIASPVTKLSAGKWRLFINPD